MREVYLSCSCGGGANVKVEHDATNAVTECACGKLLMATAESANWRVVTEDPPTLGLSVGDGATSRDVFGG